MTLVPSLIRCALKVGHTCPCLWIAATIGPLLGDCQAQAPETDGCRDYPSLLRRSIAREALGQALYEQRAVAWSVPNLPTWKALQHETRERFREEADVALERVKPQPRGLPPVVVTGLRPVTGRVIGAIEPDGQAAS